MGMGSLAGWQCGQHVTSGRAVLEPVSRSRLLTPEISRRLVIKYSELPGSGGVTGKREVPPAPKGFGQDLPTLRLDPKRRLIAGDSSARSPGM